MWRFLGRKTGEGVPQHVNLHAARAASLSLPWPPKARRPGRISDDEAWARRLQSAILSGEDLPMGVSSVRPEWWKAGMAISRPLAIDEVMPPEVLSRMPTSHLL